MKTKLLVLVCFFSLGFLFSCEKDKIGCPTCDDDVTWDGYGDIKFGHTGYDGELSEDYSSSTNMQSDCGWQIYNSCAGGVGDTYQVFSSACDTSVILIWMWGNFNALVLNDNWKGYFNNPNDSIQMGCSMKHFLDLYPNYTPWSGDSISTVFFTQDNSLHYFLVDDISEHISYVGFSLKEKKLDWLYITGYY
jgi:hypothetical protein